VGVVSYFRRQSSLLLLHVTVHSLHDVHKANEYRARHVSLSVRMIKLENRWTDLDVIWYGLYATGEYPKILFLNFLQSLIPTWRDEQTCEVGSTLAPLAIWSYSDEC
jgi:hypothetical protein